MIIVETANSTSDLQGILELQRLNHAKSLAPEEITTQGFVTVSHTFEQLLKLNNIEKHIIAKESGKVIGYVLAMTKQSKAEFPIIIPMFNMFDETYFKSKAIADYNYLVVGQICIDKSHRGQGIFDECYVAYKERYKDKYDFAVTEIAKTNVRSLRAHKRVGFKEIRTYASPDNVEWAVVIWDWN